MTHKVTYVTKFASATIRVLNWFYGITLLFTTIIGLAMKNKIEKKEENMNQEENMNNDQYPSFFVCNNCGPAKPVYSEVFTTESSKPYKVELIQQSYLYPEIADEIKILSDGYIVSEGSPQTIVKDVRAREKYFGLNY